MANRVRELQDRVEREMAAPRPPTPRTRAKRPAPPPPPTDDDLAELERSRARLRAMPFVHLLGRQEDFYAAITKRRQQFGWTLNEANDAYIDPETGKPLADRHLSKIEVLRDGAAEYMRRCFSMATTKTVQTIMLALGLVMVITDEDSADELFERAPSRPICSRRVRGAYVVADQPCLPCPHGDWDRPPPLTNVSVGQVAEAVRSRRQRARLKQVA